MSGSQRASGGAVLFGIVLLFATGAYGFYLLTRIVPSVPAPPASRFEMPSDEELESFVPVPEIPPARDAAGGALPPMMPVDLPELLPAPMGMMDVLPER
jgi:hypothetical protein